MPGALSSGAEKGADFREVLSSIVGIVEEKHSDIPIPRGGGTTPDYWTEMDGKLLGVSWTPNTSEAVPPNDGDVCLLSRILEDTVPEKYYLSRRACLGIIRRSCKRGKTIPAVLMSALQKQAGLSDAELEAMKTEALRSPDDKPSPVFRESSDRFESDRAVRHCEDSGSAVWNGRGQHTIDFKSPSYTLKVRGGGM